MLLQSAYRAIALLPMRVLKYPHHLSTVFSQTIPMHQGLELLPPSDKDYDANDGIMKRVLVVDYRYTRFALDPRTGLFSMARFVRELRACKDVLMVPYQGTGGISHGPRRLLYTAV
jgi:cation-transporting ATPase 13A2